MSRLLCLVAFVLCIAPFISAHAADAAGAASVQLQRRARTSFTSPFGSNAGSASRSSTPTSDETLPAVSLSQAKDPTHEDDKLFSNNDEPDRWRWSRKRRRRPRRHRLFTLIPSTSLTPREPLVTSPDCVFDDGQDKASSHSPSWDQFMALLQSSDEETTTSTPTRQQMNSPPHQTAKVRKGDGKAPLFSSKDCDDKVETNQKHAEKKAAATTAPITPIYLRGVPPTRVGKLFREYEERYWERKIRGELGPRSKHFTIASGKGTSVGDLTIQECHEFRALAKRFTDRMADRTDRKGQCKERYRLKKYGPTRVNPDAKTEAQRQATAISSARSCLTDRLRKILSGNKKVQWTARNTKKLQKLAEMADLKPDEMLVKLYKQWLKVNQEQSCIRLP